MNRRDFLKRTGIIALLLESPYLQATPLKKSNPSKVTRSGKTYLTPLSINNGLFSTKKAVRLVNYDGTETSGFIQNKKIKNGKLEVSICGEKDGLVLIKLPCRMSEDIGSDGYLTVKTKALEYV